MVSRLEPVVARSRGIMDSLRYCRGWSRRVEKRPSTCIIPYREFNLEKTGETLGTYQLCNYHGRWESSGNLWYRTQLIISKHGYVDLVPMGSRIGEKICVNHGMGMPLIIRNLGASETNLELSRQKIHICERGIMV